MYAIESFIRMLAFNTLKVPYVRKAPTTDTDDWGEEQQLEISGVAIDMKLSVTVVPMVCALCLFNLYIRFVCTRLPGAK